MAKKDILINELEKLNEKLPSDTSSNLATDTLNRAEKQAHIDSFKQDTAERKSYARKAFWFVSAYMGLVFTLLFLLGFDCICFHFSDAVIITLITTTTTTVIGIFILVMQYLFNKK